MTRRVRCYYIIQYPSCSETEERVPIPRAGQIRTLSTKTQN